jgi:hypothetical protein
MPDPINPAQPGQSPVTPADPKAVEPKGDDVAAQVAAALKAEREKWQAEIDEQKRKDADAAAQQKAKDEGRWKELADKAEQDRDAERASNRRLRQSIALRDHLAAKHPEYIGSAVDIAAHVPADADGDKLGPAIEKAAAEFVARNPRAGTTRVGPPAPTRTANRLPNGRLPIQQRAPTAGVASSRF